MTASSRSLLARSVARCLPQVWSTRCAWTSYPSCSGAGKRYFGWGAMREHLLEDPDVEIQGTRVLHLRHRVRQ